MLPYIALGAALIYFVLRGLGWLDDLGARRSGPGGKDRWEEIKRPQGPDEKRLEVFREFFDSDSGGDDEGDE